MYKREKRQSKPFYQSFCIAPFSILPPHTTCHTPMTTFSTMLETPCTGNLLHTVSHNSITSCSFPFDLVTERCSLGGRVCICTYTCMSRNTDTMQHLPVQWATCTCVCMTGQGRGMQYEWKISRGVLISRFCGLLQSTNLINGHSN